MLPRALSIVATVSLLTQSASTQPASKIYCTEYCSSTYNLYPCYLDGSEGVKLSLSGDPKYLAVDWTSVPQKLYVGVVPDSGASKIIQCNTDGTEEEGVVTN